MDINSFIILGLTVGTIAAQVFLVFTVFWFFFLGQKFNGPAIFLSHYGLIFAGMIALIATIGSLFYSEVMGFTPCTLCWFQRIFMYSQVIIFAVALLKKDRGIIDYSIALSCIGAFIAAYHYLLQLGIMPSVACSAVGYSVSCSAFFTMYFGYITIPLISLTAFVSIIVLLLFSKIRN